MILYSNHNAPFGSVIYCGVFCGFLASFLYRINHLTCFFLMSTISKMRHYICPVVCHSSCHGLLPHVEWCSSSRNVLFFSLPSVPSICLLERSCIAIHTLRSTLLTQYRKVTQFCCGWVNYLSVVGIESSGGFSNDLWLHIFVWSTGTVRLVVDLGLDGDF